VRILQPGTVHWMAPELMMHGIKTEATDVYALGIVLWELWATRTPYAGMKVNDIAKFVRQGGRPEIRADDATLLPSLEENTAYHSLVCEAWHEDYTKRPRAADVVARLGAIIA
jgi:serine/threonine protein kinase